MTTTPEVSSERLGDSTARVHHRNCTSAETKKKTPNSAFSSAWWGTAAACTIPEATVAMIARRHRRRARVESVSTTSSGASVRETSTMPPTTPAPAGVSEVWSSIKTAASARAMGDILARPAGSSVASHERSS